MRREKRKEVRTTLGTEEDGNKSERREDFLSGMPVRLAINLSSISLS